MNQQTHSFATVNGTKFHYELRGDGPPLVLVHAGICDMRMWDEQMDALAEEFTVLRFDQRGYGRTPVVDAAWSRHDDLHALMHHFDMERASIIGCSIGGTASINFALTWPRMIDKLVTVCSTPQGFPNDFPPPPQAEELDALEEAAEASGEWDLPRISELETQIWVDGAQRTPDEVDAKVRQRVYEMNLIALGNEVLEIGDEQGVEPPAAERLGELSVPTLAIVGALDRPHVSAAADAIVAEAPNAQKTVMDGVAHLPSMEAPQAWRQIVLDFLATDRDR